MASNQMSAEDRKFIKRRIQLLTCRALYFYPCPLPSRLAVRNLWYSLFHDDVVDAYEKLEAEGYELGRIQRGSVIMKICDHRVRFHLDDHADPGPTVLLGKPAESKSHKRADFSGTGITREEFEVWLENVGRLDKEIDDVFKTLDFAIKNANTPGQLRRMIPDILQYMPQGMQDRMTVRASALPAEWSGRPDPGNVQRLSLVLARCYLMPPVPQGMETTEFKDHVSHKTWVRHVSVGSEV